MKVQVRDTKDFVTHNGSKTLDTFTLVHPFYNEKERFMEQWTLWQNWPAELKKHVNIVIVDDGSPDPVHTWITPSMNKRIDFNFSIYRITENLKWNTPGALNLGFMVAPTEWVLCMDSDCGFGSEDLMKFLGQRPQLDAVYKFPRKRIGDHTEDLANDRYLPCSMLMHKDTYWACGGMDEDFTGSRSGGYAFFDTYFDHCLTEEVKSNWYIWHDVTALEWMESKVGPKVYRSTAEERHNRRICRKKQGGELPHNKEIMRFQWDRTFYRRIHV